ILFFWIDHLRWKQRQGKPKEFVHPDVAYGQGLKNLFISLFLLAAVPVSWIVSVVVFLNS
ncbi:MAG TPA: hypothetical protein VIY47_01830, partial [Ignavibacteriaceae bacterium]